MGCFTVITLLPLIAKQAITCLYLVIITLSIGKYSEGKTGSNLASSGQTELVGWLTAISVTHFRLATLILSLTEYTLYPSVINHM